MTIERMQIFFILSSEYTVDSVWHIGLLDYRLSTILSTMEQAINRIILLAELSKYKHPKAYNLSRFVPTLSNS